MGGTLKVWSGLYYLTDVNETWRQEDWTANRIIKVLKGQPFNGYFGVNIGGKWTTFDAKNCTEFLPPLLRGAASKLGKLINGKFDLVPIPNSTATIKDKSEFRTLAHARVIAEAVGPRASAVPALRWRTPKTPAHEGGTRDPQALFANLKVVQKPTNPVVLFDDVMTTGAQMIASYRRLAEAGIEPTLGFVIGRSTREQKENMIGWHEEILETEDKPVDLSNIFGS